MIDGQRLQKMAASYGIQLEGAALNKIDQYAALLVDWNSRINLTAITQPEEIEVKHMLDSLLLAAQPELEGEASLVDVGSGAGFPGVVAKLYRPQLRVTLMEPTGKRVSFLNAVAAQLDIPLETVKERAEEAARKGWREKFDVATARAVAGLPALCEYCLPLVRVGGLFIAMKGNAQEEIKAAAGAMQKLGGKLEQVKHYDLPDGSARDLVYIRKIAATPKQYPRNGGTIAKKPLA